MNYRFVTLAMLFVACLITANIIAVKVLALPFGFVVPAGIIVFPLSYAFNDVISEVYGIASMRRVILLGFVGNLIAVAAIGLSIVAPPASFWPLQPSYVAILGFTPRLLIASFAAYLVGELVNAHVLVWMKRRTGGRYLWTRTIGSTVIGEALDTCIFVSIAFVGIIPAQQLVLAMLAQWIIKIAYEVIATPATYWLVGYLRRDEA